MTLKVLRYLVFCLLLAFGSAAASGPPKKIYVPNPTGDVSAKVGGLLNLSWMVNQACWGQPDGG